MSYPALDVWHQPSTRTQCRDCWDTCLALLEHRLPHLAGSAARVEAGCAILAEALRLSPDEVYSLRLAARYHGLGLLAVPDALILNASPLDAQQADGLRMQSALGGRLIAQSFPDFPEAVEATWFSLEQPDGGGPYGLRNDEIPLLTGIVGLVKTLDALLNGAPNQAPLIAQGAVASIERECGRRFVPGVVRAFREVADRVCGAMALGTHDAPVQGRRVRNAARTKRAAVDEQRAALASTGPSRLANARALSEIQPLLTEAAVMKIIRDCEGPDRWPNPLSASSP